MFALALGALSKYMYNPFSNSPLGPYRYYATMVFALHVANPGSIPAIVKVTLPYTHIPKSCVVSCMQNQE